MTTILYYDTETTGLPNFKAQAENHTEHPGIAQLAAVLVDGSGKTRGAMDVIYNQPRNVIVSPEATAIHGIGREEMDRFGVDPRFATKAFIALLERADKVCAHNHRFDQKMMRIEMHRNGLGEHAEGMRTKPVDCTMDLANEIMKMPPTEKMMAAGFNMSKKPKLEEAYRYFMGSDMVGAHNAWVDVGATIAVHNAIMAKTIAAA